MTLRDSVGGMSGPPAREVYRVKDRDLAGHTLAAHDHTRTATLPRGWSLDPTQVSTPRPGRIAVENRGIVLILHGAVAMVSAILKLI